MSKGAALALSPARRQQAVEQFRAQGLPTRRVEEWKYSDLNAALGGEGFDEGTAAWHVGALSASSLPAGAELFDIAAQDAPAWVREHLGTMTKNTVGAASLGFAQGGIALRVRGAVETPLTLDFSGRGHVRALILLEPGASLTLLEGQTGAEARNVGLEILLGANAQLDHVRIAPARLGAVQVEEIALRLDRGACYRAHFASFGAKLARLELDAILNGAGATAYLSGVSVLGDQTHADVTTHIHHAVGQTRSVQLFKKVAAGKSRAVYQGRVTVAEGANGADSRQTAKALLLGAEAEADLKPELEIFADDVKCAHGAAVGDLDSDSLFYLRARGIPEREARTLLIHSFLEDAMTDIADAGLYERVRTAVNVALAGIAP